MHELINDPFYELIEKYDRCVIDYCLIEDDTPYQGYSSHKDAVSFAMLKLQERYLFQWNQDIGKAQAHHSMFKSECPDNLIFIRWTRAGVSKYILKRARWQIF